MGRLEKFKETEGDKDGTESEQFKKQRALNMKGAERTTCNETHDIRDKVVRQSDCFTPSGRKVNDAIVRSSEKPSVGSNPDLHADTTEPGINVVTAMKKGEWKESSKIQLERQRDKKVPDAVKRKVFQN